MNKNRKALLLVLVAVFVIGLASTNAFASPLHSHGGHHRSQGGYNAYDTNSTYGICHVLNNSVQSNNAYRNVCPYCQSAYCNGTCIFSDY